MRCCRIDPLVMRALRQLAGMLFQGFNVFPHLMVGKNVMLAQRLIKQQVDDAGTAQA